MNVQRPRVGISTCLLGEPVRYDGGHRLDRFLRDTIGEFVEWVSVCPEVECGLPVPREPMHLEGDSTAPRLVTSRTHLDHTEQLLSWARRRVLELEKEDLCGFVFKSHSPSSGLERVRVYDNNGVPHKTGVGIFARVFMERFPLLPVEDEGRLHDPALRENFIERLFSLKRYRDAVGPSKKLGGLVRLHTEHKVLLLAHSPELYRELGHLVAHAKDYDRGQLFAQYEALMLKALRMLSTPSKNANVLRHMLGHLKKHLSADQKQEMLQIVEQYRCELVPLIVPITVMRHYVRKYDEPYLRDQRYLNPHPIELKLRNHA